MQPAGRGWERTRGPTTERRACPHSLKPACSGIGGLEIAPVTWRLSRVDVEQRAGVLCLNGELRSLFFGLRSCRGMVGV